MLLMKVHFHKFMLLLLLIIQNYLGRFFSLNSSSFVQITYLSSKNIFFSQTTKMSLEKGFFLVKLFVDRFF